MGLAEDYTKKRTKMRSGLRKRYQTKGEKLGLTELQKVDKEVKRQPFKRALRASDAAAKKMRKSPRRTASTRVSRELAKTAGYKKPSHQSMETYKKQKEDTGKTGRDVFRTIKKIAIGGNRPVDPVTGKKGNRPLRKVISVSDPLNTRPDLKAAQVRHRAPEAAENHISEILRYKRANVGVNPNVAKGTIAKRDEVRDSAERHKSRTTRGVGDLGFGSPDEFHKRQNKKKREARAEAEKKDPSKKVSRKKRQANWKKKDPKTIFKSKNRGMYHESHPREIDVPAIKERRLDRNIKRVDKVSKYGRKVYPGKGTLKEMLKRTKSRYKGQGGSGGAGPGALAIRRPQDILGVGRRK